MILRHSTAATGHDPQAFFRRGNMVEHPESTARYAVLHAAAAQAGPLVPANDHGLKPILAVHDPLFVDLLQHGFDRAVTADPGIEEILPTQFAPWTPHRRPEGLLGQLGYHMTDTSTPLRRGTWDAVYGAAQAAIDSADDALTGGLSYALCRPPGHHASASHAGGFCYLNNAAIAAERLHTVVSRVAILDIDVHHGNGTQAIFYERGDVLYVSVHAETGNYFPYFAGYADEAGAGAGEGANLNLPLPLGSGDSAYCDAIAQGLDRIASFDPGAVVLSLGLDVAAGDPIGAFSVTTDGFVRAAGQISALNRPTAIIQEGGYPATGLGNNLLAFLSAITERQPQPA
jgi:acetoin utilization deacetylase AcuC-like enzyme